MFAVVDGSGAWSRGYPSGAGYTAARADSAPAGTYAVLFGSTNITGCAFLITIGSSGYLGTYTPGFATVVGRAGNPAGVFVQTFDTSGNLSDRSFHLAINCPPS
jgi:hypothetical protein